MRRLGTLFLFLFVVGTATAAEKHFILDPGQPLTDADRAELSAQGIRIKRPLTNGRYLVSATGTPSAGRLRIAANDEVPLTPFTAEHKILRSAQRIPLRTAAVRLRVGFQDEVTFEQARQAVAAAGGTLADPLSYELGVMSQIDVLIAPSRIAALAADESVLIVAGLPNMKVRSDNQNSAKLSSVDLVQAAPYDLTGAGVTVSLFELAAAEAAHIEFDGRLTVHTTGGATSDVSHATHVAGTIGAAGKQPQAKGMAPAAAIHQFRASGAASQWLGLKRTDLPKRGVVADNNSWGYVLAWDLEGGDWVWNDLADYFGFYDPVFTAPIDQLTREQKILYIHSAGNEADIPELGIWFTHRHTDDNGDKIADKIFCYSRNNSGTDCPAVTCTAGVQHCETEKHHPLTPHDTIGLTAGGKNSVAVGAVDINRQIANFSSRGPAKDGRVKPDVVARGTDVLSTSPVSTYTRKNGTSMSSPAVTGITALLVEQWRRSFSGASPDPAELKALLIAGSEEIGNAGPDYTFGYGLVNAKNSVDLIRADAGSRNRIRKASVAQGQDYEMPIIVSAAQNLRLVLQWIDPEVTFLASDDLDTKALVNDLDVRVTTPSGEVIRPYVLDKNDIAKVASRGVNNTDNTEVLEIANAAPGIYRALISGTRISARSPQEFVVVTSAAAAPPCVDIQEPNNSAQAASGNLLSGSTVNGALCSAGDVDFYRFVPTRSAPVSVTVGNTGDTPLRVVVTRNGQELSSTTVAAGVTTAIPASFTGSSATFEVRIEPAGALGAIPTYTFVASFGQVVQPRARGVRR